MPDVSLVLALHREGHYLPRTLSSLSEAAVYARGFGISTELVAVLDRSDQITEEALDRFDHTVFDRFQVAHADNGSLGPTRNDGCQMAEGTWILTADGDDLISFNMIERMFHHAAVTGPRAILIPKFIFAFGASHHIAEYFSLDQVSPLALIADNPFTSRVFFHRSLLAALSYQDVRLTDGYAYEDWHFNCNAVAQGFAFHATPETVLFYRQRVDSLLAAGNRVSVRQIPPSPLFRPGRYREVCGPWVERFAAEGDFRERVARSGARVLRDPLYQELLLAANAIDPTVDPRLLADAVRFDYLGADIAIGTAYHRLCAIVGDRQFDEVFLLPFMTTGGADRYILDVVTAMSIRDPARRILLIFGEPFKKYAWLDRLPADCLYIDLFAICPELDAAGHDLVCLKLIQSCAPRARLHLRPSPFAQRFFARYAPILRDNRPTFYRFSDSRIFYGDVTTVGSWAFHFVSDHIEDIDTFVCDSQTIIDTDRERFGYMPEKWKLLYARVEMPDRLDESALAAGRDSRSVLWLSRLDAEKRPELLLRVARLMARRMPDVRIDVYGRPTLNEFDVGQFSELSNIRYHGAFERLEDVNPAGYYCFLYTSRFDGMPIVLLEMIAAGLTIVAPNVGSIGDLIRDGETGVLLPCNGDDTSDAECYVVALEKLFADPDGRERMCRRAFAVARERHAPNRHEQRVSEMFGLAPTVTEAISGELLVLPEAR